VSASDDLDPYLRALAEVLRQLFSPSLVIGKEHLFPHSGALIELQRMLLELRDGIPQPKLRSRTSHKPRSSGRRILQKYILVTGLEAMKKRSILNPHRAIAEIAKRRKIFVSGEPGNKEVTANTLANWRHDLRKDDVFHKCVDRLMGRNQAEIEKKIETWLTHIETAVLPRELNPGG
jgi:hypothetical protein